MLEEKDYDEILTFLEGYKFMLIEISRNKIVPIKKRQKCKLVIVSINKIIEKIKMR